MAEQSQIQIPVAKSAKQAAVRPSSDILNFKDVLSILRQHVWLIILFTITGFIIGGISWYLFLRFAPESTSVSLIEVLSPVDKDPLLIGQNIIIRENQLTFRASLASLITQQGMFQRLLNERPKVIATKWFAGFGGSSGPEKRIAISKEMAIKDLKKHMGASADRDSDFIRVSMTCSDPCESALITNEMTELFLKSRERHGETKYKRTTCVARRTKRFYFKGIVRLPDTIEWYQAYKRTFRPSTA